ncbi:unnamed protein product [Cuscuta europaea]|uniref:AIPP2-like SPOC-like domain-containing protein n=1 Tax=Cuscuta europaea TaxID=41803 RepID=A0A9P0Z8G2_CUSEU|nr:unnamed protein product [Cuscuta europaea]
MNTKMEDSKTSKEPDDITEVGDDSDGEEDDVKVCDICGDAGREDLLAVCCRCTDGAEHTYCMRVMIEEVPEGDWLCEECKHEEDLKTQKQNKTSKVDGNESTCPAGQTAIIGSDHPGSTREQGFINVASLSRESSFKNSEKGKLNVYPLSTGTFSKPNLSSSRIHSPKVKLVDGVLPSKRKLVKGTASTKSKGGPLRLMGKSQSFKSTSSSRFCDSESIVEVPSPRFSHDEDTKGQRHTKEDSSFERKSFRKPEREFNKDVSGFDEDSPANPKEDSSSEQHGMVDKSIVVEAPLVKKSGEAMISPCDLKAAIEAAMLRKPGICRKSKVNMDKEASAQDQIPSSENKRNLKGLVNVDALAISVLLKSAIPEHRYIWSGDFEVFKSGKKLNLCDGIQAHLATCASPKVVDEVRKFPCKVLLNEVSRLSTWPLQFHEFGVREDNIALFFFAKDLLSYENNYRVLIRNLMKHDLALQGNFGGIELLIFPSNQLPEKFQRWNMMFFLWGVFRGRKVNEKPLTRDIPSASQVSKCASSHTEVVESPNTVHNTAYVENKSKESISNNKATLTSLPSHHKSTVQGAHLAMTDNMDIDTTSMNMQF